MADDKPDETAAPAPAHAPATAPAAPARATAPAPPPAPPAEPPPDPRDLALRFAVSELEKLVLEAAQRGDPVTMERARGIARPCAAALAPGRPGA
jgi:hypothetical protein